MNICPTPVCPFAFEPRRPLPCITPHDMAFFDMDSCTPVPEYQPLRPVYVWDGCRYLYIGPTPILPKVWWMQPTAKAYCPVVTIEGYH